MNNLPFEITWNVLDCLSTEDLITLGGVSNEWDLCIRSILLQRSQQYIDEHHQPLLRSYPRCNQHITKALLKTYFPHHEDTDIDNLLGLYLDRDGSFKLSLFLQKIPSWLLPTFQIYSSYINQPFYELEEDLFEAFYVQTHLNKSSFKDEILIWEEVLKRNTLIIDDKLDYWTLWHKFHDLLYHLGKKYAYWEKLQRK